MAWVKIDRQTDTLPANMATDFNGKPIAWEENGKLLVAPGGEEIRSDLFVNPETRTVTTSEYTDPPMWKELGYESKLGHIKDIQNPGEDIRLALNDIGERIMPKDKFGFPGGGFLAMASDIGSNPAGALMLGALGSNFIPGLTGGGSAPGWTSGYDLAGGGSLGGAAAGGSAVSPFDFLSANDAVTGGLGDIFGGGSLPDFGVPELFSNNAIAGLPGLPNVPTGNWWDPFVGNGGTAFTNVPGGGLNGSAAPTGSQSILDKLKNLFSPSGNGSGGSGGNGEGNLLTALLGALAGSQTDPNVVGNRIPEDILAAMKAQALQQAPNYNAAIGQQLKTINGDYLNPANNPAIQGQLQQLGDQYAFQALPQAMSSSYKSSGMSGPLFGNTSYFNPSSDPAIAGGAVVNNLNQSFGRGAGQILSQGYQQERQNQLNQTNQATAQNPLYNFAKAAYGQGGNIYGISPLAGAIGGGLGGYGLLNQNNGLGNLLGNFGSNLFGANTTSLMNGFK